MNVFRVLALLGMLSGAVVAAGCSKTDTGNVTAPAKKEVQPLVSREPALNAAPLGVEIGYANIQGVKNKVGSVAQLEDKGTNPYSKGKEMVVTQGGLGIDGLKSASFIFDENGVLAGVVMIVPKDPKGMYELLSPKYEKVENNIDSFMNNGRAILRKGESIIEINAPHMAFEMEVRYISNALVASYNKTVADQKEKEKQNKKNNF